MRRRLRPLATLAIACAMAFNPCVMAADVEDQTQVELNREEQINDLLWAAEINLGKYYSEVCALNESELTGEQAERRVAIMEAVRNVRMMEQCMVDFKTDVFAEINQRITDYNFNPILLSQVNDIRSQVAGQYDLIRQIGHDPAKDWSNEIGGLGRDYQPLCKYMWSLYQGSPKDNPKYSYRINSIVLKDVGSHSTGITSPSPTIKPEPTSESEPTVQQKPTIEPEPTVTPEPTVMPKLTTKPELIEEPAVTVSDVDVEYLPYCYSRYDSEVGDNGSDIAKYLSYGTYACNFKDLPGKHWAYSSVGSCCMYGILKGQSDNIFNPNGTLKVSDTYTVISRMLHYAKANSDLPPLQIRREYINKVFTDKSHWAYWEACDVTSRLSSNTVNTLFVGKTGNAAMNRAVSREEVALLLYTMFGNNAKYTIPTKYKDIDKVGQVNAVAWVVHEGIMRGDASNHLNPQGNITRAELACIVERVLIEEIF